MIWLGLDRSWPCCHNFSEFIYTGALILSKDIIFILSPGSGSYTLSNVSFVMIPESLKKLGGYLCSYPFLMWNHLHSFNFFMLAVVGFCLDSECLQIETSLWRAGRYCMVLIKH